MVWEIPWLVKWDERKKEYLDKVSPKRDIIKPCLAKNVWRDQLGLAKCGQCLGKLLALN